MTALFWTSKVAPTTMFRMLLLERPTLPAVHAAVDLMFNVRCERFVNDPELNVTAPLALVTPVPLIVPPLQPVVPVTSRVPVPVSVPLLNVRLVIVAAALRV